MTPPLDQLDAAWRDLSALDEWIDGQRVAQKHFFSCLTVARFSEYCRSVLRTESAFPGRLLRYVPLQTDPLSTCTYIIRVHSQPERVSQLASG